VVVRDGGVAMIQVLPIFDLVNSTSLKEIVSYGCYSLLY
jgi:hypothetical protein